LSQVSVDQSLLPVSTSRAVSRGPRRSPASGRLDDERTLVAGKRGATRLGFALLLKSYTRHGRFPATGSDLPGAVVEFVARQVQVTVLRSSWGL